MKQIVLSMVLFILATMLVFAAPTETHLYQFNGDANDGAGSIDLTAVNGAGFDASEKIEGSHSAVFDGVDDYFETNSFP